MKKLSVSIVSIALISQVVQAKLPDTADYLEEFSKYESIQDSEWDRLQEEDGLAVLEDDIEDEETIIQYLESVG